MTAQEQSAKRRGDGKEDAREDEVKVLHGRGGLGVATFIGRGRARSQHAERVDREGRMAD
jgi:hypothetical protein